MPAWRNRLRAIHSSLLTPIKLVTPRAARIGFPKDLAAGVMAVTAVEVAVDVAVVDVTTVMAHHLLPLVSMTLQPLLLGLEVMRENIVSTEDRMVIVDITVGPLRHMVKTTLWVVPATVRL